MKEITIKRYTKLVIEEKEDYVDVREWVYLHNSYVPTTIGIGIDKRHWERFKQMINDV